MADFRGVADVWVGERLKLDKGKECDLKYFAAQSRENLLYLMFFTSELINVAKGIRSLLGVIVLFQILVLVGLFR